MTKTVLFIFINVKVLVGKKKRESDTGLVSWLRLAQPNTPDNLVKVIC